jgi:16S rRNA (guanine(527)-N(7))-methyltransferase RsmG
VDNIIEVLKKGAVSLGLELNDSALEKFDVFTSELLEWNKVMNLTAITEPSDIAVKHYIDSLAVLKYVDIKLGAKIADVGCGAGFPGIPMKILRPDLKLTSIDSLGKRVNFLKQLTAKLQFEDCDSVHARAEEVGAKPEFRENFDFAVARAVAQLDVLTEYCLPLVKVGGAFIAMKREQSGDEIERAQNAVKQLGGKIENVFEFNLPDTDLGRTIVVIRKIQGTASKYPRAFAKISKNPL